MKIVKEIITKDDVDISTDNPPIRLHHYEDQMFSESSFLSKEYVVKENNTIEYIVSEENFIFPVPSGKEVRFGIMIQEKIVNNWQFKKGDKDTSQSRRITASDSSKLNIREITREFILKAPSTIIFRILDTLGVEKENFEVSLDAGSEAKATINAIILDLGGFDNEPVQNLNNP